MLPRKVDLIGVSMVGPGSSNSSVLYGVMQKKNNHFKTLQANLSWGIPFSVVVG